jgi:8-oxo-dGTP pyrophosphatase MutT (NUDIX family)
MEIWDLVNLDREVVGEHVRGTAMPPDAWHVVVHIWLRNPEGKFLMTQRSPHKKTCPLKWECVGGSVLQGETSLHAALREVREEVGIALRPEAGRLVLTQVRDFAEGTRVNDITAVYLFPYDGDIPLSDASTDEVVQAKWAARDEIRQLWKNGEMVSGIKDLSYFIDDPDGIFG